VHDAGTAVDGLRRGEHLIGHRRGEHLTGAGGIEHAAPDEAAVQRLVPRAAARDERDLALHGRACAHDDLRARVVAQDVRVGCREAGERLAHDVGRVVEELLHRCGCGGHDRSVQWVAAGWVA
jgi:hypothetical protein